MRDDFYYFQANHWQTRFFKQNSKLSLKQRKVYKTGLRLDCRIANFGTVKFINAQSNIHEPEKSTLQSAVLVVIVPI